MVILDAYHSGNRMPNNALLWEYDMDTFDWQRSKILVVHRVVEMSRSSANRFPFALMTWLRASNISR